MLDTTHRRVGWSDALRRGGWLFMGSRKDRKAYEPDETQSRPVRLPPPEVVSQTDADRVAVVGTLITLVEGQMVPGPGCTLQLTEHSDGWLVYGWNITDQAVLITPEDGATIARLLGGAR